MIKINAKVEQYIKKAKKWQEEMTKLRMIILDCQITEEFKWGKPCYRFDNSNIVIIQVFKDYIALGYFKGYLLKNKKKILVAPGANSQTMRQIRFTNLQEISMMEQLIKANIYEAIEIEKSGLKGESQKVSKLKLPTELQNKLETNSSLKTAFYALTPGRQRAYVLYFTGAKQSKTRETRIEKHIHRILDGKGLND